MGKTLDEIAIQLKDCGKKVQLIYAFNGTGKTRLSRAFKDLVDPKNEYYSAAEPPVRCGESHLSGPTEPPIDSYSA